ncbi:MAG: Gfo/Idh/MocA family oxidoreductase [Anaerolineae bacterium]
MTHIAIIGCGNIAGPYVQDLITYPNLTLRGVTDLDTARAEDFATTHNTHAYASLDQLLADPAVEVVVNLTTHHAHKEIITQALNAGKHVYSEKPLALTAQEAQELVALAAQKGLRLACSPFTLAGEAQQTAWKHIREGHLGTVRVVYAEVNWARIETWHPAPQAFYAVGPLFDVGVYPLAILTAMFGPIATVTAYGKIIYPERMTLEGAPFTVTSPDFLVCVLETTQGVVIRLTSNFYVGHHNKQGSGIEFHGDDGSLHLSSWFMPDAEVSFAPFGGEYNTVPRIREPQKTGVPWGLGVNELATALLESRPHRFSGEHAAHVVDILESCAQAVREQHPVTLSTSFTPPAPMAWAE